MLEQLLQLDRDLFLFLNSLGSERFDGFWLFITKQINWAPVFAIALYLLFKRLGWKHSLLIIGMITLILIITDQTTNHFFKYRFMRLRPGSDPSLDGLMRAVKTSSTFSFISGHASNSMAVAYFLFRVLKPYLRYMGFIFIWPFIFAYSRIYLGLHYPLDIICGYIWGIIVATVILKLYAYLRNRFFPKEKEFLDHPGNSEPVTNG